MENNKWSFGLIVFVILLSLFIFLFEFKPAISSEPVIVYSVYLDGKNIGTINSKDSFEEFINGKENELKEKYDVDTVYTPKGVEIKKNLTYNNLVSTDEQIYNKIISTKKFTVRGYQITIKDPDDEDNVDIIYVLSKDIFDQAIENTIKAFVDKDQYEKFVAGTQEE